MKQELIEHIKSQLNDFDLEYREGAWERFQAENKTNRKFLIWRKIMGAAAILLLMLLVLPWRSFKRANHKLVYHPRTGTVAICSSGPVTKDTIIPADMNLQRNKQTFPRSGFVAAVMQPAVILNNATVSAGTDSTDSENADTSTWSQQAIFPAKKAGHKKLSIEEMLAADNQPQPVLPSRSKWHISLAIGQAMDSRSKTDLNIGTYINYEMNSRLALISGISYNQFGGEKGFPLPDPSARSGKMMTGARADLSGIDIPLELQVKAGQIYARVGVSASAIISQQQTLDFSEQKVQVNTYVDADGVTRSETVTVNEITTEAVPEEKLGHNRVAGFYNFCLGYQQKISKNRSIGLEPFIKIPMSVYSEQRLNLVQGGLRVKVDF